MAGKVAPALLGMEEIVAEEDSFEDWFDFRTTILASAFLRTKMLHEEVARPSTTERAACPRSERSPVSTATPRERPQDIDESGVKAYRQKKDGQESSGVVRFQAHFQPDK
ncbi:MAG: hypothetical protein ABSG16_19195 [Candidatus Acidiferrum sp.]|jgi:hypothetical protein